MSNLPLPGDDEKKKNEIPFSRIVIWVIVGGIGAYLLISGIVGILVKAG